MEKFFKLKQAGTNVRTEVLAGITTFFAMAYVIFVCPAILTLAGMPHGGVFLATIIASVIGTLVMGLFANVPYAQAPGMGLIAFFTYTVCFKLGFSWQEALALVFLCGVINIIITVTKIRKYIVVSIPKSLQNAIGGGIGCFIAYLGIKDAGFLNFIADPGSYVITESKTVIANSSIIPGLVKFDSPGVLLAIITLIIMVVLVVMKSRFAILGGIAIGTILAIPMGVVDISSFHFSFDFSSMFTGLGQTFGAAFGQEGMLHLFKDPARYPLIFMTIFAFSLSDTFDTLGTFIGTGRRTGIFSEEDEKNMINSSGFKSRLDKALFADSIATSIGAVFGASNTTTYVESAAGIGAGGRTGLTSVVTAICFILAIFLAPIVTLVPAQATAAALIIVGIMMTASFLDIDWTDFEVATPAFFASIFMVFAFNIAYGIAFGFFAYIIVKLAAKKIKEINPVIWISSLLFLANFVIFIFI